jgi:asparagine synthase (glutamine-hydrolysing)
MCGITGFLSREVRYDWQKVVGDITDTLVHRGPDDGASWIDPQGGIALGHRRLSIVDLSAAGSQPMHSTCGRYVIAFNGEIYNHNTLRASLSGPWKGHSDTETLLAAFATWGLEATLARCVGMFAIALWDRRDRRLHLMRDRMGEKPLYYGWSQGHFLFGSELKALRRHPAFDNQIDRDALCLYFRHNYIPAPYSIYQNMFKLEPGCMLSLGIEDSAVPPAEGLAPGLSAGSLRMHRWWSLSEVAEAGQHKLITDEEAALTQLETRLREAIEIQSIADVPLGAFLSGGIDSSLVVALMQTGSNRPVHTYTIGFHESAYNEASHAKTIAEHLGTHHTELYVSAADGLDVVPDLPHLFDEPFADSSQIPTYLVSRQARQHVTVALSGDAGDELFAGYNRHLRTQNVWNTISKMPSGGRQLILKIMKEIPPQAATTLSHGISYVLPKSWQTTFLADKLLKLADRLDGVKDCDDLYYNLVSEWKRPAQVVVGGSEPPTLLSSRRMWPDLATFEDRMMYLDSMTYLPGDILTKVDRAAMSVSLETRVPFLDHRVVELAWRIPVDMKICEGQGKQVLRKILDKYVPRHLIERPKQGFGVPIGAWLRGPLRAWAERLLDKERLQQEGYLHADMVWSRWQEHLGGRRNWEHSLWSVLMFQAWLESQHRQDVSGASH